MYIMMMILTWRSLRALACTRKLTKGRRLARKVFASRASYFTEKMLFILSVSSGATTHLSPVYPGPPAFKLNEQMNPPTMDAHASLAHTRAAAPAAKPPATRNNIVFLRSATRQLGWAQEREEPGLHTRVVARPASTTTEGQAIS
ncbi:hypothetical protein METBIDRAFT_179470 [Metschnikowia bicuspidata var. bicuspidata NRRL YB-4993]|uniref:Secreted protein n=1 Tax=Metschnikowia bicuspidata var. bicuspidata NRRL YB-4993 TaxID=869754 RepID=A0A1A0HAX8_9ASCO|nr:hypothetical protein METBIDRAFT_179470 [Metschnikowia bicuspidata var. bicuspidata NRRL YB-4993]OBA21279.1 hypothetical protein METBIDRAFT_179470 [Metschnikowia bicuspidata var. bicuspidata NRRL YB-4993]